MESKKKSISTLKILLLQIRENDEVKFEELNSFAYFAGVERSQITVLNVFDTPHFPKEFADNYDALFIGGASEASVLRPDEYQFVGPSIELIKNVIAKKIPTFASCFGFQLAIIALGGEIIRDETSYEMGTVSISLSPIAKDDLIFKKIKDMFYAVSVHKEKTLFLPDSCELLAFTEDCIHSFKVKQSPFWAFQFHPELDKKTLTKRLGVYKDQYTDNLDHYYKIISELKETAESNSLVRYFIEGLI